MVKFAKELETDELSFLIILTMPGISWVLLIFFILQEHYNMWTIRQNIYLRS